MFLYIVETLYGQGQVEAKNSTEAWKKAEDQYKAVKCVWKW